MIIEQLVVGMMSVCCYLVACEETKMAVIIDPGGDDEKVLALCEEKGYQVKYIINTHAHPDHNCGNAFLKKATGAEIVLHEDDVEFFSRPDITQFFSALNLTASPPADKIVKDGDTISFGAVSLKVLHTPGHTPGGMCLYAAPNLFSGDTLFAGGVGRTDFPGGDTSQLLKSIQEKLFDLPADTVVWPGHGYGGLKSTLSEEKRSNPFLDDIR